MLTLFTFNSCTNTYILSNHSLNMEAMILASFSNQGDTANLTAEKQENWSAWWSDELAVDFNSMGYVITVAANVVNVRGLNKVMLGEVVYLSYSFINAEGTTQKGELVGQALNLNNDGTTGVVLFGDETLILSGNMVFGIGQLLSVSVGASSVGLVLNTLGKVEELPGENQSNICVNGGRYDENRLAAKLNGLLSNEQFLAKLQQTGLDWAGYNFNGAHWGLVQLKKVAALSLPYVKKVYYLLNQILRILLTLRFGSCMVWGLTYYRDQLRYATVVGYTSVVNYARGITVGNSGRGDEPDTAAGGDNSEYDFVNDTELRDPCFSPESTAGVSESITSATAGVSESITSAIAGAHNPCSGFDDKIIELSSSGVNKPLDELTLTSCSSKEDVAKAADVYDGLLKKYTGVSKATPEEKMAQFIADHNLDPNKCLPPRGINVAMDNYYQLKHDALMARVELQLTKVDVSGAAASTASTSIVDVPAVDVDVPPM